MPWDMEERVKGGVSVTIDSDGTQTVRSVKSGALVAMYFWNGTIGENCRLPEFVRHMLYEQRDAHRHCFRLHRSYRLPVLSAKKMRLRYDLASAKFPCCTYEWYKRKHLRLATWRTGLVAKRVVVCNPSEYLPC